MILDCDSVATDEEGKCYDVGEFVVAGMLMVSD